tara:strand:+ start:441 stop:572 length:132 start_codon:yes stop_codon:yes gene_type:complete
MKLEEIFNRIQTQWDNARTKEEAEEIESWTAEKFIFFDKDFKG